MIHDQSIRVLSGSGNEFWNTSEDTSLRAKIVLPLEHDRLVWVLRAPEPLCRKGGNDSYIEPFTTPSGTTFCCRDQEHVACWHNFTWFASPFQCTSWPPVVGLVQLRMIDGHSIDRTAASAMIVAVRDYAFAFTRSHSISAVGVYKCDLSTMQHRKKD